MAREGVAKTEIARIHGCSTTYVYMVISEKIKNQIAKTRQRKKDDDYFNRCPITGY